MYSSANHKRVSPRGKPLNAQDIQENNRWGIKVHSATQSIALWNIGGATDIGGWARNSGVEEWVPTKFSHFPTSIKIWFGTKGVGA